MTGRTKLISVALAAIAALTMMLGAAPAQARVLVGFGFYPFYRPFFPSVLPALPAAAASGLCCATAGLLRPAARRRIMPVRAAASAD